MAHTFSNLLAHIIFSTKDRLPLIKDEIKPDLLAYIGGIVRELHGFPMILNGTADHVHMLVRLPADLAPSECLQIVKTNSSRWVHEKWPERGSFGWQTGYAAFSVSESVSATSGNDCFAPSGLPAAMARLPTAGAVG